MEMNRLTITQRIKIIEIYYKNGDYDTLRGDYGLHNRSTTQIIWRDWSGYKS